MSKQINPNDKRFIESIVHSTISLDSGSDGISSVAFSSESIKTNPTSDSATYYGAINQLFYLKHYIQKVGDAELVATMSANYGQDPNLQGIGALYPNSSMSHSLYQQYKTKWHGKGILYNIKSENYGSKIKPNSFILTDTTNTDSIIVKDDGDGNLYASGSNYIISQSNTSPSSSDNYVGNIFYEHGIVIITETGSYKSGNSWNDVGTNYSLSYDSTMKIRTMEIDCVIEPGEFVSTRNYSILKNTASISNYLESYNGANQWGSVSPVSRSIVNTDGLIDEKYRRNDFTPYFTKLAFYNQYKELIMVAHMSNPIKKLVDSSMTITVQLDFI